MSKSKLMTILISITIIFRFHEEDIVNVKQLKDKHCILKNRFDSLFK